MAGAVSASSDVTDPEDSGAAVLAPPQILGQCRGGVEVRPCADGAVTLGDPFETGADERRRGQVPGCDPARGLGRAEAPEVGGLRAHPVNTASGSRALTMYCPASTISEILRSTPRLASRYASSPDMP